MIWDYIFNSGITKTCHFILLAKFFFMSIIFTFINISFNFIFFSIFGAVIIFFKNFTTKKKGIIINIIYFFSNISLTLINFLLNILLFCEIKVLLLGILFNSILSNLLFFLNYLCLLYPQCYYLFSLFVILP